jgi:hypothetical protein
MFEPFNWPDMADQIDTEIDELRELDPLIDERLAVLIATWHASRMERDFFATFGHHILPMLQWFLQGTDKADARKRVAAVAFMVGANGSCGWESLADAQRHGIGSREILSRYQAEAAAAFGVASGPNSRGRHAPPAKESFCEATL